LGKTITLTSIHSLKDQKVYSQELTLDNFITTIHLEVTSSTFGLAMTTSPTKLNFPLTLKRVQPAIIHKLKKNLLLSYCIYTSHISFNVY